MSPDLDHRETFTQELCEGCGNVHALCICDMPEPPGYDGEPITEPTFEVPCPECPDGLLDDDACCARCGFDGADTHHQRRLGHHPED